MESACLCQHLHSVLVQQGIDFQTPEQGRNKFYDSDNLLQRSKHVNIILVYHLTLGIIRLSVIGRSNL